MKKIILKVFLNCRNVKYSTLFYYHFREIRAISDDFKVLIWIFRRWLLGGRRSSIHGDSTETDNAIHSTGSIIPGWVVRGLLLLSLLAIRQLGGGHHRRSTPRSTRWSTTLCSFLQAYGILAGSTRKGLCKVRNFCSQSYCFAYFNSSYV